MVILQCMEKIIKEKLDSIDKGLAESIVKQAAHELTQSKVLNNCEPVSKEICVGGSLLGPS